MKSTETPAAETITAVLDERVLGHIYKTLNLDSRRNVIPSVLPYIETMKTRIASREVNCDIQALDERAHDLRQRCADRHRAMNAAQAKYEHAILYLSPADASEAWDQKSQHESAISVLETELDTVMTMAEERKAASASVTKEEFSATCQELDIATTNEMQAVRDRLTKLLSTPEIAEALQEYFRCYLIKKAQPSLPDRFRLYANSWFANQGCNFDVSEEELIQFFADIATGNAFHLNLEMSAGDS